MIGEKKSLGTISCREEMAPIEWDLFYTLFPRCEIITLKVCAVFPHPG